MKRIYFGTDGVRGRYQGPVINEDFAAKLGEAAARYFCLGKVSAAVVVGWDTRRSGESLARALASGIGAAGVQVRLAGVVPTPALALATVESGAAFGVMITASHNPAEDNGIKFFNAAGGKLTDEQEAAIEGLLPASAATAPVQPGCVEAAEAYRLKAEQLLARGTLTGWRIVLDAANGATTGTSCKVLEALGATVVTVGHSPDGTNINAGCGSEHPEALAERVLKEQARLGIAHDGDGDRCVLCDETGSVLDGDEIVAILATHALAKGALRGKVVVVTQQSNLGLDAAVRAAGGRTIRTQVGDRYVLEGMRESGAILGGESSGHIVALDVTTTGDGLVAALKVLQVMAETGKPLSQLRQVLRKFPQKTAALKVREKKEFSHLNATNATVRSLESELGKYGRVLVRYSGTEPKIRLLVEGPSESVVTNALERLEVAVRADLDVI
ncbi:MAG: phosphoglucosamine mutase [Opitutaceae bacterium]|nr:phosphoglucosamine mutase [Opitutaceae bacterium]